MTNWMFENYQLFDTLNSEIPADPQSGEVQVVQYPFGDFDRDCDVDVVDIMIVREPMEHKFWRCWI